MTPILRIRTSSILSSMAFLLFLVAGCNTEQEKPIEVKPIAPATPAPIEDLKKDLTTPTIIKPNQPPAPAAEPKKP
jgi:hypothetical protein